MQICDRCKSEENIARMDVIVGWWDADENLFREQPFDLCPPCRQAYIERVKADLPRFLSEGRKKGK